MRLPRPRRRARFASSNISCAKPATRRWARPPAALTWKSPPAATPKTSRKVCSIFWKSAPPNSPEGRHMADNDMAQPLAGIRVVEIGQNIAGPYASEILSSLGAEVIKIERPGTGDDARGWGPPFWRGTATTFQAMNHGKKSIALDLRNARHVQWLHGRVVEA